MQLDQILSAAVAAVNEVQQLPSPDVPQYSPTSPSCAAQEQQQKVHYPTLPLKYEIPESDDISTNLQEHNHQQHQQYEEKSKPISFPSPHLQETENTTNPKSAFHIYNEALHEPQDTDGFGDISFFALDDDNLVITSQQALEMFESQPEETNRHYANNSYQVLNNNGGSPPEVNTPPLELTKPTIANEEGATGEAEVPITTKSGDVISRGVQKQEDPGGYREIQNAHQLPEGEPPSFNKDALEQWPIFMDNEVPLTNALQVTEVTEEVPVISGEVEVLTSLDAPQYTSLAPAATTQPISGLTSITDEVLEAIPGSTLDATVDANGRFVVQVVGPGVNMTVQNNYIGREEEVMSESTTHDHQPKTTAFSDNLLGNPMNKDSPYTTYNENFSTYPASRGQEVSDITKSSHSPKPRSCDEPRKRSSVLTALRDSIYRSRAKKRPFEENLSQRTRPPPKRRPADILKDLQIDCETPDRRGYPPQDNNHSSYPHRMPASPRDHSYPPQARESYRSPIPERRSTNDVMVLRPEELKTALKLKGRHANSSPLVVMRPDDLHAEGGDDGTSDPMQVQLVYLVYPMDGAPNEDRGDRESSGQRKRKPEYAYTRENFSREMPSVPLPIPTASEKRLSLFHDDGQRDQLEYNNKLIKDWTFQDVVYFMIDNSRHQKSQDINIAELSGITGRELCYKTIEDFKRYAPATAHYLFEEFRKRVDEENRQHAAAQAVPYHHEMQNSTIDLHPNPFDFINQSNNVIHTMQQSPPHSLQPPPPPPTSLDYGGGCDASAPYEVRYETIDARSIAHDNMNRGPLLGVLPSASMKSFDLLQAPSPAVPFNTDTVPFNTDDHLSDPDQSSNEEEIKPEPPKKRGPGRPRKPENELKKKKKKTGRLWEFIRNLLLNPETCPSLVRWENPEEGIFRFVQAEKVAQRWGERKKNKDMNYEKLSRAMRYYYKGEVFEAVLGRRLVYKFGKNAKDWRPSNPNFVNHTHFPGSSFT